MNDEDEAKFIEIAKRLGPAISEIMPCHQNLSIVIFTNHYLFIMMMDYERLKEKRAALIEQAKEVYAKYKDDLDSVTRLVNPDRPDDWFTSVFLKKVSKHL